MKEVRFGGSGRPLNPRDMLPRCWKLYDAGKTKPSVPTGEDTGELLDHLAWPPAVTSSSTNVARGSSTPGDRLSCPSRQPSRPHDEERGMRCSCRSRNHCMYTQTVCLPCLSRTVQMSADGAPEHSPKAGENNRNGWGRQRLRQQ